VEEKGEMTKQMVRNIWISLVIVVPWLWPSQASAAGVFVQVGAKHGQGYTRTRLGKCMVVTPWHVVESIEMEGGPIEVHAPNGETRSAKLVRQLAPDLAVLEIEGENAICSGASGTTTKDIDSILEGWRDLRVQIVSQDGTRRIPRVVVSELGRQEVRFRSNDNFQEGDSGAIVEGESGRVAMIMRVDADTGEAIGLRADFVDNILEPFFVEMNELPQGCASDAPEVVVRSPTRWSELLRTHPSLGIGTEPWALATAPARLAHSPRLVLESDLIFDAAMNLIACKIELKTAGRWILAPSALARAVTLNLVNAGGEIRSSIEVMAGPPPASPGARDAPSYDRGERRGCSGTDHGGNGRAGEDGRPGGRGSSAGHLVIAALSIIGPFRVDLTGGPGGTGGDGGKGGPGGDGAGASSGSSSLFDCKCGGSPGGRGGDGGIGGRGGRGGDGGAGGTIQIVTTSPVAQASIYALAAGPGGAGGRGGLGGEPGRGGNASGGTGFCSAQRSGADGNPGAPGKDGERGAKGSDGRQTIQPLRTESGRPDLEGFFRWVLSDSASGLDHQLLGEATK